MTPLHMKQLQKAFKAIPVAAMMIGTASVATIAGMGLAHADNDPTPRISVSGEGEATLAPDMAILNLSVVREAATAREALTANNDAMRKVLASMKESGIAERDLQTSGINIQPRYQYPDKNNGLKEARITGYTVSNSLTVRIRDINAVGGILDKSVTLGVNRGGGLQFTNDNPKAALAEARKRAVVEATEKAKTLAEASGVNIGRILDINEQSYMPRPIMYAQAMRAAAPEADSVPMAAGENSYRVNVNISFEIKQ